jgi:hypothetical protein
MNKQFRRKVVSSEIEIEHPRLSASVWRKLECGHYVAEFSKQIEGRTWLPNWGHPKPARFRECRQCKEQYFRDKQKPPG